MSRQTACQPGTFRPHRIRRRVLWTGFLAAASVGLASAWRWQLTWGSTASERDMPLPGDELIARPRLEATRAIGIDAPPEKVWPWLVQLGQDKGGFYSLDRLENLVGLNIHSAHAIRPEWQDLAVDDKVHLAESFWLRAALVEPGAALVLKTAGEDFESLPPALPAAFTWAFVLEPEGPGGTRLVVRERYDFTGPLAAATATGVSWISWLMTQAMLRGIQQRVEVDTSGTPGPGLGS